MEILHKNIGNNIDILKSKTGNSPDIIIKEFTIFKTKIAIIYNETLSDKDFVDRYVLLYLSNAKEKNIKKEDTLDYLEKDIPTNKTTRIKSFDDLFYNLLSGFTIILVENEEEALSLETRGVLDSGVNESKNEMVVKGPKDAFTENYQTNIGLIRRRIKTEDLWLNELVVGLKSKTKVGILYVKNIANQKFVDTIIKKIENINIDSVFDSNYIIELISENKKSVFANYISTERPDQVCMYLLNGRIAIVVENTQYVVIIPAIFADFFHTTEDFYQKLYNVNFTRLIRIIAFLIAVSGPAIYIAITTYNIEAIPDKLLLSFVTQRTGVPLPTVLETALMIVVFEIIRETDSRLPNAIGSSLSIVGALVLGQAAVTAGIVSPITIIVVSITSICGMITYNMDMVGGVRWWRFAFLIISSFFGLFGVLISGLIFIISVTSIKSFGTPFITPIAPLNTNIQSEALFLTNKHKFEKRNPLTTQKSTSRQEAGK